MSLEPVQVRDLAPQGLLESLPIREEDCLHLRNREDKPVRSTPMAALQNSADGEPSLHQQTLFERLRIEQEHRGCQFARQDAARRHDCVGALAGVVYLESRITDHSANEACAERIVQDCGYGHRGTFKSDTVFGAPSSTHWRCFASSVPAKLSFSRHSVTSTPLQSKTV